MRIKMSVVIVIVFIVGVSCFLLGILVKDKVDNALIAKAKQIEQDYKDLNFVYGANKIELDKLRIESKLYKTTNDDLNIKVEAKDLALRDYDRVFNSLISYIRFTQVVMDANGVLYPELAVDVLKYID